MNTSIDLVVKGLYTAKRLDAYLAEILHGQFSREDIKRSLEKEAMRLNGKPARPRDRVQEGDHIQGRILLEEKWPMKGEDIPLRQNLLFVNNAKEKGRFIILKVFLRFRVAVLSVEERDKF